MTAFKLIKKFICKQSTVLLPNTLTIMAYIFFFKETGLKVFPQYNYTL